MMISRDDFCKRDLGLRWFGEHLKPKYSSLLFHEHQNPFVKLLELEAKILEALLIYPVFFFFCIVFSHVFLSSCGTSIW